MKQITRIGRFLYGIGIAALGVRQLITKDLRAEVLPAVPVWAHEYLVFPIITGMTLLFTGLMIAGLFKLKTISTRNACLYLGCCFLVLAVTCHLPYILFFSPNSPSRLDAWFDFAEALAYGGGAFVMAGSFPVSSFSEEKKNGFRSMLEKLIPCGGIFYAVLIIMFGWSHFVFAGFVSTLVPKWLGAPMFWTYFVGAALIGSGIAIIFEIWIKPVAFLLAFMLFLFFLFFHMPDAIENPYVSGGKEIVRAMIALLFCGIALVIATKNDPETND